MRICEGCGQAIAEGIEVCPSCGGEVDEGLKRIDHYRIEEILHEGPSAIVCRTFNEDDGKLYTVRIFTPQSGINDEIAYRLKLELEELKTLPEDGFVRHYELTRSSEGLWYRVSEWVEAEKWGDLLASGKMNKYPVVLDLFHKMATILGTLHDRGYLIPHLILDDILIVEDEEGKLQVKIDYKLSRFLDPRMDRPSPMLNNLLACHPDIKSGQPLDFRSDIWSLGKIFVEILTADFNTCSYGDMVEPLPLPFAAKILLKVMLAEDPELRPSSMAEVAEVMAKVRDEERADDKRRRLNKSTAPHRAILNLQRRVRVLIAIIVLILIAGAIPFYQNLTRPKGPEDLLENYANLYAPSVAFVAVEYWIKLGGQKVYRNWAEGTAFLVDSDGYLLTNRHVACPWLVDDRLRQGVSQMTGSGLTPEFGYRTYLWFAGAKAFKTTAGLVDSPGLADVYFLEKSYKSHGQPKLNIAGVAHLPVNRRQVLNSPLQDDYAILKIDRVPEGLVPLPLAAALDPIKIPKLSPVIALGFPLGRRTQETEVNVSVTRGHVRRSFPNLIQLDAALYGGNSGGPVIDTQGRVIGLASGVATQRGQGLIPMPQPLWNIGMVYPIRKVAADLAELKAGRIKWNGLFDFSVGEKLNKVLATAKEGRWAAAAREIDKELATSRDPGLVMAGAMLHFCAEDLPAARRLFEQTISVGESEGPAKFMILLIDWLRGQSESSPYRKLLMDLDWRSPLSFFGYLSRLLEGQIGFEEGLRGWETFSEKSWLSLVGGLIKIHRGDDQGGEEFLRQGALAAMPNSWEYLLTRAALSRLQAKRADKLKIPEKWQAYQEEIKAFEAQAQKAAAEAQAHLAKLAPLGAKLQVQSLNLEDRIKILEEIIALDPTNQDYRTALAFFTVILERWDGALAEVRRILKMDGRESAGRLSIGLLEPIILRQLKRQEESEKALEAFLEQTMDPWYRSLARTLLGRDTEMDLTEKTAGSPELLLTGHVALGLWSEASGELEKAAGHYKIALESHLDAWLEYDLALQRMKKVRQEAR